MNERDNLTSWEREHHRWMALALLAMSAPKALETSWDRTLRDIRALPEFEVGGGQG